MNKGQELMKEFEDMKNLAELKALSNYSLEHPLTDEQYNKMMELKNKIFNTLETCEKMDKEVCKGFTNEI